MTSIATFATQAIKQSCNAQAVMPSPLGEVLLARTPQGLAGAWFLDQKYHPDVLAAPEDPHDPLLRECARQLTAYFAGVLTHFDLPLDLHGTPFQRGVWARLLLIEPATTCSYGDIARAIHAPAAVRAVGAAVGRNPISVIVPCHRVIGTDGSLTGYAGGMHRKRALLKLEGAHVPALATTRDLFETF